MQRQKLVPSSVKIELCGLKSIYWNKWIFHNSRLDPQHARVNVASNENGIQFLAKIVNWKEPQEVYVKREFCAFIKIVSKDLWTFRFPFFSEVRLSSEMSKMKNLRVALKRCIKWSWRLLGVDSELIRSREDKKKGKRKSEGKLESEKENRLSDKRN